MRNWLHGSSRNLLGIRREAEMVHEVGEAGVDCMQKSVAHQALSHLTLQGLRLSAVTQLFLNVLHTNSHANW